MKVIHEKDAKHLTKTEGSGGLVYSQRVMDLIKEIDEFAVETLRPMVDARSTDGFVLIYPLINEIGPGEGLEACLFSSGLMQTRDGVNYEFAELQGWIRKPIYTRQNDS